MPGPMLFSARYGHPNYPFYCRGAARDVACRRAGPVDHARRRPPDRRNDPFPAPIAATEGVIRVNFTEFASIPDVAGQPARMMLLVDEPGTRRLFVNDMRGPLYSVSYDGKTVDALSRHQRIRSGACAVQSQGNERGFQSFAFHPQFNQAGARGFGKFYTYTDTSNMTPPPDFTPRRRPRQPDARHGAARVDGEDARRRDLRRRRAARADPPAAAVRQPQRRPARVQPARRGRARRTSACSTWASPTAAAAAIR